MVKVTERNSGYDERQIIVNMITNPAVLAAIAANWDHEGMFVSPQSNIIARWCINHHSKGKGAPGRFIEGYLENWAKRQSSEPLIEAVRDLLYSVTDEYDHQGTESESRHIIDIANKHFNMVRYRRLGEKIISATERDQIEDIEKAIADLSPIRIGEQKAMDLFNDEDEFLSTFDNNEEEALFSYGGDLGEFLGNTFAKGEFVAFVAGPKVGKSHTLADIAWRCMCKRQRVAYFEVGDLGRNRTKKRLITRALGHPWRSTNPNGAWPCRVNIPKDIDIIREKGKVPRAESNYEERLFQSCLVGREAWQKCKELVRQTTNSERSFLRVSTHPANSVNVAGIRSVMDNWARTGWRCDVAVIDYADILAPMPRTGKMDVREQINQTWIELRRMSQELHCLVVTASQSDADGYGRWLLTKSNFNGDRRKNDHVTAMLTINQTAEEKETGHVRWNFTNRREAQFNPKQCIFIAQCLALGRPVCVSSF